MQRQGFNRAVVVLHWLLAVSIFFLFISSWWMMGLPLPSEELQFRAFPFQLHKKHRLDAGGPADRDALHAI